MKIGKADLQNTFYSIAVFNDKEGHLLPEKIKSLMLL